MLQSLQGYEHLLERYRPYSTLSMKYVYFPSTKLNDYTLKLSVFAFVKGLRSPFTTTVIFAALSGVRSSPWMMLAISIDLAEKSDTV